jgi:competence protein ComGC
VVEFLRFRTRVVFDFLRLISYLHGPPHSLNEVIMYCATCGSAISDPVSFCPKCGARLPVATEAKPASASTPAAAAAPTSAPVKSETDLKAVLSLVLGLLSFVLSVFSGIPAVILGHLSRASIRKSGGRLKGEGMALGGLIMGYISVFLVPVLLMIVGLAIPNYFRASIVSNEASALKTLSIINNQAASYKFEHNEYPPSLQELSNSGVVPLDSELASLGTKNGYRFTYDRSPGQKGYVLRADPLFLNTGERHFYSDASGVIRYAKDHPAGSASEPLSVEP